MGRERAATMMSLVPPAGWGDVATRRDLHLVEARVDALDSTINARIDALRGPARSQAGGAQLSGVQRTLGTWLFASQAAVIAAVSVLIALD